MTIRLSTGMVNKMLDGGTTGGVKGAFGGFMAIFAGSQPADADSGSGSAVLLGTATNNDDGVTALTFDAAVAGVSSKAAAQTWKFHGLTTGVAGWFMLYQSGDTYTGSSTTYARITGTIGTAGADANISNTNIVTSAVTTIDSLTIQLPKS
jgi:hypothetical protein